MIPTAGGIETCDRQPRRRPSLQPLIRHHHRRIHRLFPKTTTAKPISIDVSFLFYLFFPAALSLPSIRIFTPVGEFRYVTSVRTCFDPCLHLLPLAPALCPDCCQIFKCDILKSFNLSLFISLKPLRFYSWILFVLFTDQCSTTSLARLWVCSNERAPASSPLPQSSR